MALLDSVSEAWATALLVASPEVTARLTDLLAAFQDKESGRIRQARNAFLAEAMQDLLTAHQPEPASLAGIWLPARHVTEATDHSIPGTYMITDRPFRRRAPAWTGDAHRRPSG
jgi:hypothetical protein